MKFAMTLIIICFLFPFASSSKNFLEESDVYMDSFCSKAHAKLSMQAQSDRDLDFFKKWRNYKEFCEKTGEYELYKASFMQYRGHDDKAQDSLVKLINRKNINEKVLKHAYFVLNLSLNNQRKYDKMISLCKEIIQKYPDWARGYSFLSIAYMYKNDLEKSEVESKQAILLNSELTDPYLVLTVIYHLQYNNPKEALKNYRLAISKENYYWLFRIPQATYSAVYAAMNQKNYKLAKWVLVKQIEFYPEQAKEQWYIDLANKVRIYFEEHGMDPTKTFTEEEVEGLSSGKITILDIVGND